MSGSRDAAQPAPGWFWAAVATGRAKALRYVPTLALALAVSCSSSDKPISSPPTDQPAVQHVLDTPTVRPFTLPSLTRVAEPVRKQLQEQYASLTRTQEEKKTGIELGTAYGEMGKLLMAGEYRGEADVLFNNARALAPNDMRWPYYLGHLYKEQGESGKAAAAFERALSLRPDDVPTLVWLGEAYLGQNRAEAAEPLFAKARSLEPRSVAAVYGLGRAALARQQYARAVELLEEALGLDAHATIIHYPLAMAFRGLGERERADDHLRRRGPTDIRRADPLMEELATSLNSAVAYEVRGAKALDEGEWAAAAGYFRKGIELAPNEPSLRHKLGTALAMMGDAGGAAEQFQEAVRRSPSFTKAHYSLGLLLMSSGRLREAIDEFSAAVTYDPTYAEARLQLAEALRHAGRLPESLKQYEQVIQTDPRLVQARFGSAQVLARLTRYQEARDRLTEATKAFPDRLDVALGLARLLAAAPDDRVRDGRQAMAMLQELVSRDRTSGGAGTSGLDRSMEFLEAIAMAFAELGQFDEATKSQRDAIGVAEGAGRRELVPLLSANLKLYEGRRPCRTPWSM